MIKIEELKPNEKEKEVLSLFYNRFYDLYEEVVNDDFINNDTKIFLKDIISEEVGMKFCMALMRAILDTQVENPEVPNIKIMSQVYLPIKNK